MYQFSSKLLLSICRNSSKFLMSSSSSLSSAPLSSLTSLLFFTRRNTLTTTAIAINHSEKNIKNSYLTLSFFINRQQNQYYCTNSKILIDNNNNDNNNKNNNKQLLRKFTTNSSNLILYSKFTVRDPHHTIIPAGLAEIPLTDDRAYEILLSLNENELKSIKNALERYEAKKIKEGFEGKLAATRWRSRFGRPAKMPALGDVDPTGSYCAVPADWLRKKSVERAKPPETKDLWKIFLVNAVPFIGFGFLDNFTMIIAGDYIENVFGMFMCISTMAAAGLGNTISDILGIGSAYYIERLSEMLGLRPPELTPIQLEMKSSRRSANVGRIFGITLGCLIGMFPLLFMDTHKKQTSEQDENKSDK